LGVRANLDAIEAHLKAHPDIDDAAVILSSDRAHAIAFVTSNSDDLAGLEQALDRHCRDLFSPWICPQLYHILATLPRTPSGKKDRMVLEEMTM
jgi:acyl-coenzyme A synthetase/AMP-(fatty) acid ligase